MKRPTVLGVNWSVNDRLRTTMLRTGVTAHDLARCCGVDIKTVERWLSADRVPHRRHRWAASQRLGADETYLWPQVLRRSSRRRHQVSRSELVDLYPDRASVPRELWLRLLTDAREQIDVLVFSGTFFAQTQPRVASMLAERLRAGVQVRLCFGNPTGESVAIRDREEELGGTLAAKIRASLTYYRGLVELENFELRLHDTTLYASMFRYDDEVIVNPHMFGEPASVNPALHLRKLDGGILVEQYITSFERVWKDALPWLGQEP